MHSETLKATDAYSANNAIAPRVSLKDMEDKIVAEHYFNAASAIVALGHPLPGKRLLNDDGVATAVDSPLDGLTICLLVMQNGFVILGKSAPASMANFDEAKGRRFAYEDAIKQLWPLEGYALRDRLSAD